MYCNVRVIGTVAKNEKGVPSPTKNIQIKKIKEKIRLYSPRETDVLVSREYFTSVRTTD